MNKYSIIANEMAINPQWETKMAENHIKVKYNGNLVLFMYDIGADFSLPMVQEARGIVINKDNLDVVAVGFNKFGNYVESYASELDWTNTVVQEKIDGSIMKLYYYNQKWNWATNGTIFAQDAENTQGYNFLSLIKSAYNYSKINYEQLNKDYTYIFELVTPANQIVVKYDVPKLYHLGTRSNITLQETNVDIGIEKPKVYNIHSLEEAIMMADLLNNNGAVEHEGFVAVDKYWNRVKIKASQYVQAHHVVNNGHGINKELLLQKLLDPTFNKEEFILKYPFVATQVKYYDYKLSELCDQINQMMIYARNLYAEFSFERKAVALVIKNMPFASYGFAAISKPQASVYQLLTAQEAEKYIATYVTPIFNQG